MKPPLNAEQRAHDHDCAEAIAKALHAAVVQHDEYPDAWPTWEELSEGAKTARIAAVNDLPAIIARHASNDLAAWLASSIATASGWREWLFRLLSAAVGAVALYFCASCSPMMSPEQVRKLDEAHVLMHRMTRTQCTICPPVSLTPESGK